MNGEWAYYKSHFTPEECQKILDDSALLSSQRANMGVDGEVKHEEYRRSDIKFIQRSDERFTWLYDKLWKMLIEVNDQWFNFHITKVDYMQLAEYSEKDMGEYKKHHDVFWMNGDPKYHRKLTCVIQLTDPSEYEGGELELYNLAQNAPDVQELRQQGTTIFFPSFTEHAALPVTKGTRHSLAIWFDGPKWR